MLNIVLRRIFSTSLRRGVLLSLAAMAVAMLVTVSPGFGAGATDGDPTGWIGKAAPDFALTNLSSQTVRLSDFKGKVVLLDFWATWCPPCREEIPDLVQLQKQFAGKGFTVLGVAMDEEGAAVVKPLAQKLAISYPVLIGNMELANTYGGIEALPTTLLIGRDGKVLKTYIGATGKSEFQKDIQSALDSAKK